MLLRAPHRNGSQGRGGLWVIKSTFAFLSQGGCEGGDQCFHCIPQPSPWALPGKPAPQVTEEFAALHQCSVQLPWKKAESILGYQTIVSFAEGMKRSVGWLAFAVYPVQSRRVSAPNFPASTTPPLWKAPWLQHQILPLGELFVVDAAFTDGSRTLAEQLDVRVISMVCIVGRGAVRATAMKQAQQELVLCCDATNQLPCDFIMGASRLFRIRASSRCLAAFVRTRPFASRTAGAASVSSKYRKLWKYNTVCF